MYRKFCVHLGSFSRISHPLILITVWIFGLLCGGLFSVTAGDSLLPLMRSLPEGRLSIVGLLYVPLLPFLFSAFAVYLSCPWLIYLISGCKAFSFGLCICLIRLAFGPAGWLVQFLLLFTDCMTLPVLFWLWLDCRRPGQLWLYTVVGAGWSVLAAAADWILIAPFLRQIL